jgi:hypothetical protein
LPTDGRGQQVQSLRVHELQLSELVTVFLTAVTYLAMEQQENIKFCAKLGKTRTEIYEVLRTVYGDEALSRSVYLNV